MLNLLCSREKCTLFLNFGLVLANNQVDILRYHEQMISVRIKSTLKNSLLFSQIFYWSNHVNKFWFCLIYSKYNSQNITRTGKNSNVEAPLIVPLLTDRSSAQYSSQPTYAIRIFALCNLQTGFNTSQNLFPVLLWDRTFKILFRDQLIEFFSLMSASFMHYPVY